MFPKEGHCAMTITSEPPVVTRRSYEFKTGSHWLEGHSAFVRADGRLGFKVSTPPEFRGDPGAWSPEMLFVTAVDSCLMLTFANLAQKEGLRFAGYSSTAEGHLEWIDYSYRFTRVTVRPAIAVTNELDVALARRVLERAHAACLVANSLRTEVVIEPAFSLVSR
jgi:organic hydroperoxide reductase OsmC/OhrA